MQLHPEIEVELIFDDKELDLSTRQADIGIFMRRPKQLNYIQKKLIDINYHIYASTKYLAKKYPLPELTEKTFSLSGMTSCQFSLFRLFKVVFTNLLFGAL